VVQPDLYRRLGVAEFFLFDPMQEYLDPPVQGYRLSGEGYEPLPRTSDGWLEGEQLGLRMGVEDEDLALRRLDTGERLLTAEEALQIEAESRRAETEARRAAEAEVARLREELRRRVATGPSLPAPFSQAGDIPVVG